MKLSQSHDRLKHSIWPAGSGYFYDYHVSHILQHYKSLRTDDNSLREKITSSFIVISGTKHIFAGIDSTGFKSTHSSQYYTERAKL
jgi:hypothetical protein